MEEPRNPLDRNYWIGQHQQAMVDPRTGHESALVRMLSGWDEYREAHAERFSSGVGDDYVLGPEWKAIGEALLGLLNGETGRLDCGTLDGAIRKALAEEGFSE